MYPTNSALLNSIPNYLFRISIESEMREVLKSYALGIDKLIAFTIATAVSATATFIGQKYWLFKPKN
jgi:putative flippase GtrA